MQARFADVVHSDPEVLGGAVVFRGTRVPLRNLFDYLERGHGLGEFPRRLSVRHGRPGGGGARCCVRGTPVVGRKMISTWRCPTGRSAQRLRAFPAR